MKMRKKRWTIEEVEEFCGWDFLGRMVELCKRERDRALLASAFLTGGRINEVLRLKKEHFDLSSDPNLIVIRAMPVSKRFEKVGEVAKWKCLGHCKRRWAGQPDPQYFERHKLVEYKGWITRPKEAYRTFVFPKTEPLVPLLINWLDGRNGLFDIGYDYAYKAVTALGVQLGTWIPTHWFRAQRASQLALEYNFDARDLAEFFKWRDYAMALRYASKGWRGLAMKMVR